MRKATVSIVLALLVGMYLDSVLFNSLNIFGTRPDALLAVIVSISFMIGSYRAGIAGLVVGLFMDVLFNKIIGLNAAAYMLCGIFGGIFYKKYYADNVIIPAITAAILGFAKELAMAIITLFRGGTFSFPLILATYILPCALLTALFCALVHIIMRPLLKEYARKIYERDLNRNRLRL